MFWLYYPWHQPHQIRICPYHATSGTGGGIGLLYRKDLKIEQLETNVFKSFEFYGTIQAHLLSVLFSFVDRQSQPRMVSHMLYFSINSSTLLEPLVCASGKLLLTGDLNFHVNNPSEGNAYQCVDVLSCFNLNALNVNIPIHKLK